MGLKEAYQEKLEAQFKEWSAKVMELQAKTEMAKADAKIELHKHLFESQTGSGPTEAERT